MVFFLKRIHDRIDGLDKNLADSFAHVRQDNENLYAWVRYLHEESEFQKQELLRRLKQVDSQESRIASQNRLVCELKQELSLIPKSRQELKAMVDEVCSLEPLLDRIHKVEQRIDQFEIKRASAPTPILKEFPAEAKSALKERVLRRIARNSKEYIKSVIIGIIRKYGKISALELRDMIIEEQGLCSKSSFYRILEELEAENVMNLVSRGKEKVYLSTQK